MVHINKNQLFVLIILFEIGSTTLFALGIDTAKQDAWLAILIAFFVGCGLLWIYTDIQRYYFDQHWGGILTAVLGRWISKPVILMYALYFIYIASLNLFDFGMSTVITVLPGTPIQVVLALMVMLIIYIVVFLNIEVLSRTAEILMPVFLFFLIAIYILVIISGIFDFKNLLPVLENKAKTIMGTALFSIVNFPFGEMIVFLMYWHHMNSKQIIRKTSFLAFGISGVFIIISNITIVAVLGVSVATIADIPLFHVIQKINIGNFITRLDPLGIVILFIGGFFKMVLHFYAGLILLQSLFKIAHNKWIIIIICILFWGFTYFHFPNVVFQRWVGLKVMVPYIHTIFQVIIPCLILLLLRIKCKKQTNRNEHGQ